MRKLLFFATIIVALFISPTIPFFRLSRVAYAVNYVDEGYAKGIDSAILDGDMNIDGHLSSIPTRIMGDWDRRILGPIQGITTNSQNQTYLQQMRENSFAYQSQSIVAYMYANPPANTYAFVRDMGESLGFIPKSAYAQGIGFSGLSALLPLWKAFRNISYLLLALFMIVIGFFIMFRKKIDPKTVVTVQNALPNIIVTLLLITFSYAIVGLLIDFMYLLIMISISILRPISRDVITNDTIKIFVSGNFWDTVKLMWTGGLEAAIGGFLNLFGLQLPKPEDAVNLTSSLGLFSFFFSSGQPVGLLVTPFIVFIFGVSFLFAIIRLLIMLIKSYIQIIMSVLISPFHLLLGAFPGSHAFEGWINNLIANLSVFPITAVMILIGSIMTKYTTEGTKLWGPPMLNPTGNEGMASIIALGVLFAIPSVAGSLKEALKAKAPVGMGIGGAFGFAQSAGQQMIQYGMQKSYYEKSLRQAEESSKAQERFMQSMADAQKGIKIP